MRTKDANRPVMILAAFGSTEPAALADILGVEDFMRGRFPEAEVSLAFTSGFIRKRWRGRVADADFRAAHPEIPGRIYALHSPLAAVVLAAERGHKSIWVQSLHISNGEEFQDLAAALAGLRAIETVRPDRRPFPDLRLGASAFGRGTPPELERAARALRSLADEARRTGSALLLMGHGAATLSNQVYVDFEAALRRVYADLPVFVALVDGEPDFGSVLTRLEAGTARRILLAPLMLVAGEHARNDLAGPGEESWLSRLLERGFEVDVHLRGLGGLPPWMEIYEARLREALAG